MSLDHLLAQRASIAGSLSTSMESRERLTQAEREEATCLAEIGALGKREADAMSDWAKSLCPGEPPQLDMKARQRLAERLAQAQAQAEAARGAIVDVDAEQRRLSNELSSVNDQIDVAAFDALAVTHAEELALFDAFVARHVRPKLARLLALHAFIVERAQLHQASGRDEAARPLFHRAEGLSRARAEFDFAPSAGEVLARVETWSRRYSELTGTPALAKPTIVREAPHFRPTNPSPVAPSLQVVGPVIEHRGAA